MSSRRSHVASLSGLFALWTACVTPSLAQSDKPRDFSEVQRNEPGVLVILDRLHIQLGDQKLRQRWYEGAFQEARYVLNLVPNHPQGLILLVQACEQWKSPKCNVEEAFRRALAINPDVAGTYTTQGIYLHRARKYTEAIESFKRALDLDPNSVNAQYNIGLTYIETKQYDLANQHAQQAYALGAPFPGLRNRLQKVGYWKPAPPPEAPAAQAPSPQPAEPRDEAATAKPGKE